MLRRVLVADDPPFIWSALRTVLSQNELEVVGEAQDGQEAIDDVLKLHPDLVVLDLIMPSREWSGRSARNQACVASPEDNFLQCSRPALLSRNQETHRGRCFRVHN